jgi:hypothetical protein
MNTTSEQVVVSTPEQVVLSIPEQVVVSTPEQAVHKKREKNNKSDKDSKKQSKKPFQKKELPAELNKVCRDFMNDKCTRDNCRFVHDTKLCGRYYKNGSCKFKENCRKNHFVTDDPPDFRYERPERNYDDRRSERRIDDRNERRPINDREQYNTERRSERPERRIDHREYDRRPERRFDDRISQRPEKRIDDRIDRRSERHLDENRSDRGYRRGDELQENITDMRLIVETGSDKLTKTITNKDVVLAPNMFTSYKPNELMEMIKQEVDNCGIPKEELFKLWHSGAHQIADDKLNWKDNVPTFNKIIERMAVFFNVKVEATRLNLYKENDYKFFHRDSSAFNERNAKKQNFTICLNLGATRTVAFRTMKTRTIVSVPLQDGEVYCFSKQVNIDWEHGVYKKDSDELRMSIVIWGMRKDMIDM